MKNKNGFTLIELLAVILILGIIALIAIPTVNKIINEARYGAFKSGNDNIMKTIEKDCQTSLIKGENPALSYIFTEGKSNIKINVKGALPSDGYIFLNNTCNVTNYYLSDGKNIYSNEDDIRKDYMLKASIEEKTSIFKTMYPDYYNNIIFVHVINDINIPENAIEIKDPSVSEKGKIKSWLIPDGENYHLYIGSNNMIYANFDSSYLFSKLLHVTDYDLSNFSVDFSKNLSYVFNFNENLLNVDVSNWNISNATNISYLFYSCYSVLNLNVSNWDTSNVTTLFNVFYKCENLTKLDVENWEVSNVIDMRDLFDTCHSLKELNLGSWDISKVTQFRYFVRWCSLLTKLNIDNWKINNITDISTDFINGVDSLTFISMKNTNYQSVNKLISILPSRVDKEAGTIDITGVDDISSVNISAAQNKNLIIIS